MPPAEGQERSCPTPYSAWRLSSFQLRRSSYQSATFPKMLRRCFSNSEKVVSALSIKRCFKNGQSRTVHKPRGKHGTWTVSRLYNEGYKREQLLPCENSTQTGVEYPSNAYSTRAKLRRQSAVGAEGQHSVPSNTLTTQPSASDEFGYSTRVLATAGWGIGGGRQVVGGGLTL